MTATAPHARTMPHPHPGPAAPELVLRHVDLDARFPGPLDPVPAAGDRTGGPTADRTDGRG